MGYKRKIFLFYKLVYDPYGNLPPEPEFYAFTENKELAELFLQTRGRNSIIMHKKSVDELYLPLFENKNKEKMLFMNVLTDGKESFDFPTTYYEDDLISHECEVSHDKFLESVNKLLVVPFKGDVRMSLEVIYNSTRLGLGSDNRFGAYNTFNIFTKLFNDTLV